MAAFLTTLGVALFAYFIYTVGIEQILEGIARIGVGGFLIIQLIYLLRLTVRATAWRLSVYAPYRLDVKDTLPAVIIGEALSSMIPLGILVSGTAKAVAVRKRVPLVVGLSSVATENLFYSFVTGLFICLGSFAFLRGFDLTEGWVLTIDLLIGGTVLLIFFGIFIVIKQWHFASEFCEWLYNRGVARGLLESGRLQVRLFENLIYGFYRKYPKRFVPIFLCQIAFHSLGILEAWFILSRIREMIPNLHTAFLLESISRAITIFFKFVPFVIGVDEAGAQFVTETLAIGAGVGVTLAIIRKGRILFWATVGLLLIAKRGFSVREIFRVGHGEEGDG
ncbi:MAG: lysylphosphatidylglycerol synthase domain-containing protein [Pyrinomonadaceae bacterium]